MIDRIQWLGHGSFFIQGPPFIYIDPWRVSRHVFHADVILISHSHYEHCSPADIDKLRGARTKIITSEQVAREIPGSTVLRPWQSVTIDRASIKAVPAYSPDSLEHPVEDGGLGFIISINRYDIYYAGDTQLIPEMKHLRPDIAILPIDGRGTLNIDQAAQAVRAMRPRWVIPANWDKRIGSATPLDVLRLRDEIRDTAELVVPLDTPAA